MYYSFIDWMLNNLGLKRNDLDIRFVIDGRRRIVRGCTPLWIVWHVIFMMLTISTLWSIMLISIIVLG